MSSSMITVNFTESTCEEYKKIAEIIPVNDQATKQQSWQQRRIKLTVQGETISKVIIDERDHA